MSKKIVENVLNEMEIIIESLTNRIKQLDEYSDITDKELRKKAIFDRQDLVVLISELYIIVLKQQKLLKGLIINIPDYEKRFNEIKENEQYKRLYS